MLLCLTSASQLQKGSLQHGHRLRHQHAQRLQRHLRMQDNVTARTAPSIACSNPDSCARASAATAAQWHLQQLSQSTCMRIACPLSLPAAVHLISSTLSHKTPRVGRLRTAAALQGAADHGVLLLRGQLQQLQRQVKVCCWAGRVAAGLLGRLLRACKSEAAQ